MSIELNLLRKLSKTSVTIRTFRGITFLCEYDNAIEKVLPETLEVLLEHELITPFIESKSVITEKGRQEIEKYEIV